MSEQIPDDYNVYFAGWDRSGEETVTSAVVIHHPSGDIKKISLEDDSPTPFVTSLNTKVWRVEQFEIGATEGGSSGSPLFDQNGRIIGQLHGGRASCNGTFAGGYEDYYGRMDIGWDGSALPTRRLKDWLDPDSSSLTVLNGYGPSDTTYALNAVNVNITKIPKAICEADSFRPNFTFKNNGSTILTSATIQSTYNGVPQPEIIWTGSIEQHNTETIELGAFSSTVDSTNTIEVVISEVNGAMDENPSDNTTELKLELPASIQVTGDVTVSIYTDAYETSWRVKDAEGIEITNGGLFSDYDRLTPYQHIINFPSDGCYAFILYDNYGDGMCCGSGNGFYSLGDENGNVLADGAEFGGREVVVFQKTSDVSSSVEVVLPKFFTVFPNPNDGILNVNFAYKVDIANLKIMNSLGQAVMTGKISGHSSATFDIQDLEDGTYILEVITSGKKSYEQIILTR